MTVNYCVLSSKNAFIYLKTHIYTVMAVIYAVFHQKY